MKALDAIRIALKFSDMGMTHLSSMKDAPLLRPGRSLASSRPGVEGADSDVNYRCSSASSRNSRARE